MADQDKQLDQLFAQAREARDVFPDDLAVRIEIDAEAVRLARSARTSRRTWRQRIGVIGGWHGLGGLVAASAAGVWIGFSAPTFLPDPVDYFVSQEATYLMADLNLDENYLEDAE
ncbi:hypothetical protein RA27_01490 [Ruegeria sp. ANG-R]|uniref:hypothetical protein n=1 Tax=Ruegeria sp. ANG-R TaxID=1577903 RepID=UPI00057FDC65|nr:hypothetical protein [Ruegeria sp. ANG-R]KIC42107.1 hypothetical protein RA27_01490 [Ruegeria sp. ANG-R]